MGVKKRMTKIQTKAVVSFDQMVAKWPGANVCLLSGLSLKIFGINK